VLLASDRNHANLSVGASGLDQQNISASRGISMILL
jgi:hypothetical protein